MNDSGTSVYHRLVHRATPSPFYLHHAHLGNVARVAGNSHVGVSGPPMTTDKWTGEQVRGRAGRAAATRRAGGAAEMAPVHQESDRPGTTLSPGSRLFSVSPSRGCVGLHTSHMHGPRETPHSRVPGLPPLSQPCDIVPQHSGHQGWQRAPATRLHSVGEAAVPRPLALECMLLLLSSRTF